jgi:hypothetical protein
MKGGTMATMTTFLPIQSTFDIALARKVVRMRMASRQWATASNARVGAAVTALGELILLPDIAKPVAVKFDILEQPSGVQLSCNIFLSRSTPMLVDDIRERLERAADELDVKPTAKGVQILARLWIPGGRT